MAKRKPSTQKTAAEARAKLKRGQHPLTDEESLALRAAEAEQERLVEKAIRALGPLDEYGAMCFLRQLAARQDLATGKRYAEDRLALKEMLSVTARCAIEAEEQLSRKTPASRRLDRRVLELSDTMSDQVASQETGLTVHALVKRRQRARQRAREPPQGGTPPRS
jgi:hypothetical protein